MPSAEIFSLAERRAPNQDELLAQVVRCAQECVVAQTQLARSWDRLREALEDYTGQHWTRWDL